MKIIILTLLLTGGSLLAQIPAPSDEDAARIELLRQATRQRIAETRPAILYTNPPAAAVLPPPVRVSAPNVASELVAPGVTVAPFATNAPLATPPVRTIGVPMPPPALPVLPAAAVVAPPEPAVPPPVIPPPVAGAISTPPPVAAVVPPAAPPARPAKPEDPVIPPGEMDFPAMDLEQVLTVYAQLVGRSIIKASTLPAATISFKAITPLTKSEAIQALESVFSVNGISTVNQGDKFVKVVPTAQAPLEAEGFNTDDPKDLPESGRFTTQMLQLQYVKPSDIQPLLATFSKIPNSITPVEPSTLIIRDTAETIKRMRELIEKVDVYVPAEIDSEVIPIRYAQASDIASALGSLGGGSGTSVGRSSTGGSSPLGSPAATRPGTLNAPGGGLGAPGSPGYNPGAPGGALGGARTTSLQDRLRSIVSKAQGAGDFTVLGQTKIIADERTNSLLVFAGKQDMDMIKKIVGQLDTVLAQVLIEAIIMEVTLNDNKSLGVSYLQKDTSQAGSFTGIGGINNGAFLNRGSFLPSSGTNGGPSIASGLSYFANFGGDFQATLTAAADDSHINILSRPRIQTSHGVQASLQIGDTVPYVTGTYFNGVNGTPSSQYQQTFVGINLQVTPLINPDGLVVMDITQDVQQLGPTTKIDNNDVPTTTKRTATAKVSVRDGDTIILGGFISTTKNIAKSGVPFLKDIPGLGLLFSSSSEKKIRQELIVLIRPTVLPTPEKAAYVARQERDKSPALKGVERDYKEEEIRNQKAADQIKIPTK